MMYDSEKNEIEQMANSWFSPKVTEESFTIVRINYDMMPTEIQLQNRLNDYNLYRMSAINVSSKSPCLSKGVRLPEDVMTNIKEYLCKFPLSYKIFKNIWCEKYISILYKLKEEDEYDMMFYDIESMDYKWASSRLKLVKKFLNLFDYCKLY